MFWRGCSMDEVTTFPGPVAAGQIPWFDSLSVVAERPGRLLELVHRVFVVTRPWPDMGPVGINQRPVLLPWQVGTRGNVVAVQFDGSTWRVMCELEDQQEGYLRGFEVDEVFPEIPLQHFLSCTAALGPRVPPKVAEAANDA